jgi:hypothetical protein
MRNRVREIWDYQPSWSTKNSEREKVEMRGARDLATMIESYLEADDASTGNGSGGSVTTTPALTDYDTRQQLRQLTQTTNQLKQDNANLQKDIASLKNNLQMAMMAYTRASG